MRVHRRPSSRRCRAAARACAARARGCGRRGSPDRRRSRARRARAPVRRARRPAGRGATGGCAALAGPRRSGESGCAPERTPRTSSTRSRACAGARRSSRPPPRSRRRRAPGPTPGAPPLRRWPARDGGVASRDRGKAGVRRNQALNARSNVSSSSRRATSVWRSVQYTSSWRARSIASRPTQCVGDPSRADLEAALAQHAAEDDDVAHDRVLATALALVSHAR